MNPEQFLHALAGAKSRETANQPPVAWHRLARKITTAVVTAAVLLTGGNPRASAASGQENPIIPLGGEWRFAMDRGDAGVAESWFSRDLGEKILLPGVLQAQGHGDEISTSTPWVLSLYDRNWHLRADYLAHARAGDVRVPFVCQPPRHYLGAAWYQRDIEIPDAWRARRVVLFLERTRWESRVWVDDRPAGSRNSLCVPHEYDLGPLAPGRHRLSIRVDNRMLLPYRPDAHAVSDSLNSTWNGITGKIELRATPLVHFADLRVFPNAAEATVRVRGRINNAGKETRKAVLVMKVLGPEGGDTAGEIKVDIECPPGDTPMDQTITLAGGVRTWDEFTPVLYELSAELDSGGGQIDHRDCRFGFRDVRTEGQNLLVNGRPTHLRGTHHGGDFPLTGYPPSEPDYWRMIFGRCKEWGMNHVRFHSFCPPDAAFVAADELGLYLQVEPGMWNEINPGTPIEKMLYAETEAMIAAYGNHPSFVLLSASNEPKGRWKQTLPKWVEYCRQLDGRQLYTTGTGWSLIDEPGPVKGADFLAVHRIGAKMLRGHTAWFGRDYAASLRGVDVPVVSHELGQWCAYPDFSVIGKFTGYMRPGNYEIFRQSASDHGVLENNPAMARASGRFQLACYKEDVEANLRTPGLSGFQLLDLHDYVGQGTALVGLLDPFWEEKSHVTSAEWRKFCAPTVPLARLAPRIFTTGDTLDVPVEIAHFGAAPLDHAMFTWEITGGMGQSLAKGSWAPATLPVGRTTLDGSIRFALAGVDAPQACRLVVRADGGIGNDWNFWVYPDKPAEEAPDGVIVTSSWQEASRGLADGSRVVFLPPSADLGWDSPPLDHLPVFWNRLMSPGWSRMLGLWIQDKHPALSGFPTADHCDWQWTDLVRRARAVNLGSLPRDVQPIVQAIDDWNRNWKLGLVFEAKVGPGRLLVCSIDLQNDAGKRPVAGQLRRSLLAYAAGENFRPSAAITPEQADALWFDTRVMAKLGAKATSEGKEVPAAIDGDPNTFWLAGGGKGKDIVRHPHVLDIEFPGPVSFNRMVVVNRQNDRDRIGDIQKFKLEVSEDGTTWRMALEGEMASTWDPQSIDLPANERTRFLRLTALSGFGEDVAAALAEFAVIPIDQVLSENTAANPIHFQRARSTASDVDEGTPDPQDSPAPPPTRTP